MEKQTIQTKYGVIHVTPTDEDHVFVSFSTGSANETPLTVRGKQYSGSAHFYRDSNGVWDIGMPNKTPWEQRQSLFLGDQWNGVKYIAVSQPARNSIHDELCDVVPAWIKQNPLIMLIAQGEYLRENLAKTTAEHKEALAHLEELAIRIRHLEDAITMNAIAQNKVPA